MCKKKNSPQIRLNCNYWCKTENPQDVLYQIQVCDIELRIHSSPISTSVWNQKSSDRSPLPTVCRPYHTGVRGWRDNKNSFCCKPGDKHSVHDSVATASTPTWHKQQCQRQCHWQCHRRFSPKCTRRSRAVPRQLYIMFMSPDITVTACTWARTYWYTVYGAKFHGAS